MGDAVTLVSSAEETAKDVVRVLTELDLLAAPGPAAPVHEFRSTGPVQPFAKLAQRFLGPSVPSIRDSLASWPPEPRGRPNSRPAEPVST
jgi:glutamate racemase